MKNYNPSSLRENPLLTREDLRRCLLDLLAPLKDHAVPGGYLLGAAGAHYAPRIALMEGWSRTLWGIGPFIAGGGEYPGIEGVLAILQEGIDPGSPGFWGEPGDVDQRFVEMAAIALCLIIAGKTFWETLGPQKQEQLYAWLSSILRKKVHPSNWLFFRILVCAAFRKLGLPADEKIEQEDLDFIESCYRGEGWYEDGQGGNYDYYNFFGFHFYGMLYAKFAAGKVDAEKRAAEYVRRTRLMAPRFAAWFREDGSALPYGRSLSYRFAAASFFSACAFAGEEVLPWGVMKGLLLRNLRWWFSRPILDNGGILSVGYGYPNLVMADRYNSPGSPYWGMKAFLVLALGEDHPFWRAKEQPLPELPRITEERIPGLIVSHTPEDVQLLVPGRYPGYDMAHGAAKYGKFVYSARFGFSVSHSSYNIEMTGCDSTLLLSDDPAPELLPASERDAPGKDRPRETPLPLHGDFPRDFSPDLFLKGRYWRERRQVRDIRSGPNWTAGVWQPWEDVSVTTVLLSLGEWHIRVHRIETPRPLLAVEGGFSLPRYHGLEEALPVRNAAAAAGEALVSFDWGASRIAAREPDTRRRGALIIPSPNLNIMYPSGVIPVLEGVLSPGLTVWAAAVRGGDKGPVEREVPPRLILRDDHAEVFDSRGVKAGEIPLGSP